MDTGGVLGEDVNRLVTGALLPVASFTKSTVLFFSASPTELAMAHSPSSTTNYSHFSSTPAQNMLKPFKTVFPSAPRDSQSTGCFENLGGEECLQPFFPLRFTLLFVIL